MKRCVQYVVCLFFSLTCLVGLCAAQDIGLLPKYGPVPKNAEQKSADAKFLAEMDRIANGDRKTAANQIAQHGWDTLRSGNWQDAMRRFNQAWLIDNTNGLALWGMATIKGGSNKAADALPLFAEAEPGMKGDVNFATDYAKAVSIAAAQTRNPSQVEDAQRRFEKIYLGYPGHIGNLQNWAILMFYIGDYARAWEKLAIAEKIAGGAGIDPAFVSALQSKMARPK